MKKLLLLLLFIPLVSFGQTQIINGIVVTPSEGYSYKSKLSNKNQASFIKSPGNELKVFAAKVKDREITKKLIQTVILSGNDIIKWKLLSPMKSDSGEYSEFATISYGPNGIVGYRMGFELNGRLVMITTFATSPREAMKTILEASINIDKNN
jgi:hypothetical protein